MGADIAWGGVQRLGNPMFYGGPSAGFIAWKKEFLRKIPGRIIGITEDAHGN